MKASVVPKKRGPSREETEKLQDYIATLPQSDELVLKEYFADGMYCRELFRPQGTLIVGKVHKKEHFYMVIKGQINVFTDDGVLEMKAPYILVSKPGTKRITYAVEDSVAITIHRVSSTDPEEMEKELVEEDKKALYDFRDKLKYPELAQKNVLKKLE